VLRDHGTEGDFKVLQLGGGECAGASQVQVGSAFFEAAHERQYRDALYFQRKYPETAQTAETIVRVLGNGLLGLVTSARTTPKIDSLAELQAELAPHLPETLAAGLAGIIGQFAAEPEWTEPAVKSLSVDVDRWTLDAADYCLQRDQQIDLTGALPPRAQALNFHPRQAAPAGA
jgi:sulfite reductase (ferredoxin)